MRESLLDTDTLSEILKGRNHVVARHAKAYLRQFGQFSFSIITRYEILRGLGAENATRQIEVFERECAHNQIVPLTDAVVVQAARLYGLLRSTGQLVGDADLLIAATALCLHVELVTNNLAHFGRIPDLRLSSWNQPIG